MASFPLETEGAFSLFAPPSEKQGGPALGRRDWPNMEIVLPDVEPDSCLN